MTNYTRYLYSMDVDTNKKVKSVSLNFVGDDFTGDVNVTDLQLQSGKQATASIPNSRELLEKVPFNVDEYSFINTVNNPVKIGVQPREYKNINNRFYNIVGRGAESVALPNLIHDDLLTDLVTSALDLVIIAKDDFDLVRISTSEGSYIENRQYNSFDYPPLADHPLNKRYTREFYFGGGSAGDEIRLSASEFTPSIRGERKPLQQGTININGTEINDVRQRFILAPFGTFRVNIEFYKEVTEELYWVTDNGEQSEEATYFKDIGIGFYGYAVFNQYERGARY